MRVLVVDDEADIRRLMTHALTAQGIRVDTAGDGAAALAQLRREAYDVLLLDVLMPDASGIELLPSVFKICSDQRVMMISAINEPRTRVKCLELGAVDYLAKPFVLAELVARVRVHARSGSHAAAKLERRVAKRRVVDRRTQDSRSPQVGPPQQGADDRFLRTAGATLDLVGRQLQVAGKVVVLSERESLLLACLMRRSGGVCTRREILSEVWGTDGAQSGNVVDVYVGRLRAKLPADVITTVRNAGYAFAAA